MYVQYLLQFIIVCLENVLETSINNTIDHARVRNWYADCVFCFLFFAVYFFTHSLSYLSCTWYLKDAADQVRRIISPCYTGDCVSPACVVYVLSLHWLHTEGICKDQGTYNYMCMYRCYSNKRPRGFAILQSGWGGGG